MKHTTLFPRTSPESEQWHATAERCKHTHTQEEEEAVCVSIFDCLGCLSSLCDEKQKRQFWVRILDIHLDHIKVPLGALNYAHNDASKNLYTLNKLLKC